MRSLHIQVQHLRGISNCQGLRRLRLRFPFRRCLWFGRITGLSLVSQAGRAAQPILTRLEPVFEQRPNQARPWQCLFDCGEAVSSWSPHVDSATKLLPLTSLVRTELLMPPLEPISLTKASINDCSQIHEIKIRCTSTSDLVHQKLEMFDLRMGCSRSSQANAFSQARFALQL